MLFTRSVKVPKKVVAIHVSMIQLDGAEFIAGLRFFDSRGTTASVGYILPGKELYLDIQDMGNPDNRNLNGFHLAVEKNGIQALAAVSTSRKVSAWAGSPHNSPRNASVIMLW